MKFYNKNKIARRSNWLKVSVATSSRTEMMLWCKRNPSPGRFYNYYGTNNWWFEFTDDALAFKLKWP